MNVEEKWPVLGRHERAAEWLGIWTNLGRAPRTIDAYARGLAEYLLVCERDGVDPLTANRSQVALFVRELATRPHRRGANVVALDSGSGLSNATLQQRLVPVRLFYDFLIEEGLRASNPVGRGRYTAGHRTPNTTQHYAKINPNTLTKAYNEAGYFARNVRTIEVLIDRDAVTAGTPGDGQPWQHYDLGHGWCSYSFFEQCQHRMACARCDFYTPKGSTKAQLLEAKNNLQRMLAAIPLTDDERAAVDDGHTAVEALLARLADVPTPGGPTPNQIRVPPTATLLPIVQITQRDIG